MFFDTLERLFYFLLKRWYYLIIALIPCVLLVIFFCPPSYFLDKANKFYAGRVGFTQMRGNIWNGGAIFSIPSIEVSQQITWSAGLFAGNSLMYWDVFVGENKKARVFLGWNKAVFMTLYSAQVSFSEILPKSRAQQISGEISLSGDYSILFDAGKGQLTYNKVTLKDETKTIIIGNGIADWSCAPDALKTKQCIIEFNHPAPPLELKGLLKIKNATIIGRGIAQTKDNDLASLLKEASPLLLEPLKLIPIQLEETIVVWKWVLPSVESPIF
jgi:hypothetical protein